MSFTSDNALIVNGNFGADLVEIVITYILARPAACLVAERPHYNACTASVAKIHSFNSVKVSRSPFGIVADKVKIIVRFTGAAVSFNIRFINNIKSVNIAEHKELSVGGIVRGSDGVDIQRFHQLYVFFHIVKAHNIAVFIVGVSVIDSLDFYVFAVNREDIFFDFNGLEADKVSDRHNLIFTVEKSNESGIKSRYFRVPALNIE